MLVQQNVVFDRLHQTVMLIELIMCSTDFPSKTTHDNLMKDGAKDKTCEVSDVLGGYKEAVSDVIDKTEPSAKRKCPEPNVEEDLSNTNDVDLNNIDLTISKDDEDDIAFNKKVKECLHRLQNIRELPKPSLPESWTNTAKITNIGY
ncbi:hypothetical protein A2U01_0039583 [Trifolium medium]|uniref:Uncharacterized protein n=1 Tax=Trifolium medium TaxID=97028 RepID=A0A392Q3J7_9FABA|nr:hypothetical protein [Trifolium medium]